MYWPRLSPDTAERFTEQLRDSVERGRGGGGGPSGGGAVRVVAEAAPDPTAFLAKYHELKSRK